MSGAPKRQSVVMRLFWYFAGGALSFGANAGVFVLLHSRLGFTEEVAYAVSLALVMGFNFAWSYFVNFRTESGLRSCLPRYAVTQAAAYCINYLTTQALFELVPDRQKLVILFTQVMMAGVKFLSYHFWVFPRKAREPGGG
jgi:putative flippase GtrA